MFRSLLVRCTLPFQLTYTGYWGLFLSIDHQTDSRATNNRRQNKVASAMQPKKKTRKGSSADNFGSHICTFTAAWRAF